MIGESRPWLYYIIDETGKSYRKENGLVVAKSSRKPLRYTPGGWQDIGIGWDRNMDKVGAVRNFTLPLEFPLDGADILRTLFYKENFEKKVFLLMQKQKLYYTPEEYYFWYDFFYKGQLDLTSVEDSEDKVIVSIKEGGLLQDMTALENQKFEIPCNEVAVRMDGLLLRQSANFIVTNGLLESNLAGHTLALDLAGVESVESLGAISQARKVTGNSSGNLLAANEYFLQAGAEDTTMELTWDFRMTPTLTSVGAIFGTTIALQLITLSEDGAITSTNIQTVGGGDPLGLYGVEHHFAGTTTVTIPAGRKAILYMTANNNRDFTLFEYGDTGDFSIKYMYSHGLTFVYAVTLPTLFRRLIAKITGNENNFVSDLLEQFKHITVLSGDAIRGIPNSVIKTSFNDAFKSVSAVLCAGWGIENNKIVVESKEHFLQNIEIIELGITKEVPKVKRAKDLLVNTLIVGYPAENTNDINGKQQFNTTHRYTSPVKSVTKELDLTSVYLADPYVIELIRINLEGKTTTDSGSDNQNYFLNTGAQQGFLTVDNTPVYELKRGAYDEITGVISPATVFNLEDLTPKRMLERHMKWINSLFYGFEGQKLVFETQDKNEFLYTRQGAKVYKENADVIIGTSRTFKPYTFEFEPETPEPLVEEMQENPNRCFSFVHSNGQVYKGFNLKIGIAANTLEEQAFLLLSTDDNDMTKLIT